MSYLRLIHEDLDAHPCRICRSFAKLPHWRGKRMEKCVNCGKSLDDRIRRRKEVIAQKKEPAHAATKAP